MINDKLTVHALLQCLTPETAARVVADFEHFEPDEVELARELEETLRTEILAGEDWRRYKAESVRYFPED